MIILTWRRINYIITKYSTIADNLKLKSFALVSNQKRFHFEQENAVMRPNPHVSLSGDAVPLFYTKWVEYFNAIWGL